MVDLTRGWWLGAIQSVLLGAMLACGGDNAGPGSTAIAMTATASGDAQTGPVSVALPLALRVVVTQGGAALPGTMVSWTTSGGSVAPTSSITDASGVATTVWKLGPAAGSQTAQAALPGASGSPVVFHATATNGVTLVPTLAKAGGADGDGQSGTAGSTLPTPLAVVLSDANDVRPGVTVTWATPDGGTLSPTSSVTDGAGRATTSWTLGPASGGQTATASVAGATGSPVTFNATAVPANTILLVQDAAGARFSPSTLTVPAGTTVSFVWASGTHDVTSDGPPDFTSSGAPNGPPRTYQVVFDTPGTYNFHCSVHGFTGGGMHGTITVQ
jgi:plastocyanin